MSADPQTIERPESDARPRRGLGFVADAADRLQRKFNTDPEQRRLEELERRRRIQDLFDFTLTDHFTAATAGNFRTFHAGLEQVFGDKFTAPRLKPEYRGSDLMFAMYKDVDIHNNIIRHNNGNEILISSNEIIFNQTGRENFSMDDAFEMVLLASRNKEMLGGKVTLKDSTYRERAMLQHALEQLNNAIDPDINPPDTIFIKNPVTISPALRREFERDTLENYLIKMKRMPAPGFVFERDDDAELDLETDLPLPPAPPPPAPPFVTPLHAATPPPPPPITPLQATAPSTPPDQEPLFASSLGGAQTPDDSLFGPPPFVGAGRRTDGASNEPITVDYSEISTESQERQVRQVEATLKALAERLKPRLGQERNYIGQAVGFVPFSYEKQEWFKKVKATTEPDIYAAQVNLYEDGKTPPADILYVLNEKSRSIHLISIAEGEGYEGWQNTHISPYVHMLPEEEWGEAKKGSPVLKAAKYYPLPAAQFEDEADLGAVANAQNVPPPPPIAPIVAVTAKFAGGILASAQTVNEIAEAVKGANAPDILKERWLFEKALKDHFAENPFQSQDFVQSGRTKGFFGRDVFVLPIQAAGKDTAALVHFTQNRAAKNGQPGEYNIVSVDSNGTDYVPHGSKAFEKSDSYQFNDDFVAPIINNTKPTQNRFDQEPPVPPAPPVQRADQAPQAPEQEGGGEEAPVTSPRSSKLAAMAGKAVSAAVSRLKRSSHKTRVIIATPILALSGWGLAQFAAPAESAASTSAPSIATLTSRTDLRPETARQVSLDAAVRALGMNPSPAAAQPRAVIIPRARDTVVASLPPANLERPGLRIDASLASLRIAVQGTPQAATAQFTVRSRYTNLTGLDARIVNFMADLDTLYAQCADPDRAANDPLKANVNYGRDGSHYTAMHPEGRGIDLRANSTRDNRSTHDNAPSSSETRCLTRLFDRVERSYGLRIGYESSGGWHWHVGASRAGARRNEDDTPRNEVAPDPVLPPEETTPTTTIAAADTSVVPAGLLGASEENNDNQPPVNVAGGGAPADRLALAPAAF